MIPKYDEMILPILKIIADGKEYNNSEMRLLHNSKKCALKE